MSFSLKMLVFESLAYVQVKIEETQWITTQPLSMAMDVEKWSKAMK